MRYCNTSCIATTSSTLAPYISRTCWDPGCIIPDTLLITSQHSLLFLQNFICWLHLTGSTQCCCSHLLPPFLTEWLCLSSQCVTLPSFAIFSVLLLPVLMGCDSWTYSILKVLSDTQVNVRKTEYFPHVGQRCLQYPSHHISRMWFNSHS